MRFKNRKDDKKKSINDDKNRIDDKTIYKWLYKVEMTIKKLRNDHRMNWNTDLKELDRRH